MGILEQQLQHVVAIIVEVQLSVKKGLLGIPAEHVETKPKVAFEIQGHVLAALFHVSGFNRQRNEFHRFGLCSNQLLDETSIV